MPHAGDPNTGHLTDQVSEDVLAGAFGNAGLDPQRFWRAQFERAFGIPTGRSLNRREQFISDRFEDVRGNFGFKKAANLQGLEGFGQFTEGRTFEEELAFLIQNAGATGNLFGGGFNTAKNVNSIGSLSEIDNVLLNDALRGTGFNPDLLEQRAVRNAFTSRFGSRAGSFLAGQEGSPSRRGRFELEADEAGRFDDTFTRSLITRLRDRFGIGRGLTAAR